jgi:hypothetical protein
MKYLLIIIISILSLTVLNSQDYDFGEVSKLELQERFYPTDSSANAAILYRSETLNFNYNEANGFSQQKEVITRIKIYNKEGLDWANKKVLLYKGRNGNDEKMKGIKGYTYNLKDGKIDKSKLKNEGIFSEQATDVYEISSFTLPNVTEGSVIEYRYTVSSPFLQIDDIDLQFSIPVKKLNISVSTPQFYKYNKRLNPKAFYRPNYEERKEYKEVMLSQRGASISGNGAIGSGSSRVNRAFNYFNNVLSLSEQNIPSLSAESFGGNINNYKAKLSLELEARLAQEGYVEQSYAVTWNGVSKSIYDSDSFGGQLNKSNFFKDDLSTILQGTEDDFYKAFLIESFVKSKVKWNGNYGIYAQKGIRAAYKEGEGSVADINLLAVAMLRSQGLNANPVLVSTRNNGIPLFPTRQGFNYVVCMVESEDSYLLIDATEPFSANNVLPERVLNWQGRVIKDGGVSSWVDLATNKKSKESTMLNVKVDNDFVISGKVRKNYTSNLALKYRKRYTNLSIDDHIKSLESNKGDFEISDLIYENDKDLGQPVKVTYDYELSDGIDEVGDKLYFSPVLFLAIKENPFKLEERLYPIDFVSPQTEMSIINIMLPEGYKVESLPKSEAIEFKDGDVKFEYIINENGKYLSLKVNLEINNTIISPADYKGFKVFYSKIVEKQAEQIVLTKA